jgi:hypothetical protein
MKSSRWQWHLDEVFVKINGERHYLWRAVDHKGEVLESFVTKTRDKKAALKFLKKAMSKHGQPEVSGRFSASGACEVYRNSPPSTPLFSTISIRNAVSTHDKTSNATAPRHLPSGGCFVPHRFTACGQTETGSNWSDSTCLRPRCRYSTPQRTAPPVVVMAVACTLAIRPAPGRPTSSLGFSSLQGVSPLRKASYSASSIGMLWRGSG